MPACLFLPATMQASCREGQKPNPGRRVFSTETREPGVLSQVGVAALLAAEVAAVLALFPQNLFIVCWI
ncbi:hypothetical protein DBR44_01170 [Aquitalea sp. FJL05]|nr:hypothetical protein DBR44_01170 [Aquitalea sp. FJL05]